MFWAVFSLFVVVLVIQIRTPAPTVAIVLWAAASLLMLAVAILATIGTMRRRREYHDDHDDTRRGEGLPADGRTVVRRQGDAVHASPSNDGPLSDA